MMTQSSDRVVATKPAIKWSEATDGTALIQWDPYLAPYADKLRARYKRYLAVKNAIEEHEGGLDKFSRGYEYFGFQRVSDGISYREWAPNAVKAYLVGDFNQWNPAQHEMKCNQYGVWEIILPDINGQPAIPHGTKVKILLALPSGERIYRLPAWSRRVIQDMRHSPLFDAVYWSPSQNYPWSSSAPPPLSPSTSLRIYESHIGISSYEPKISSYREFADNVIPRIKSLHYNAIQLMAIMEHAYYASFGYQVTNFFAISSRFGTPEDLKYLIDCAHREGLLVFLDVVHSHASNNVLDGLNQFDGSDHQYFHGGLKGRHSLWDSRLFNYGHWEVLRFLLSNLRFYKEEYHFDGFRFDGVTSMLYHHHGISHGFSGHYDDYFGAHCDEDAAIYCMLANDLLHHLDKKAITIAEEVSGMPGLCRPVEEGGLGFDYRLAMAIPDMWIKLLKESKDDDWSMGHIVHTLTNRRWSEKSVAYCESHDQALVGDKTLAFWLMDKEMYTNMSQLTELTMVIDRGLSLHKCIRLITYALGGEAYLTFMGNEFGHPEWLDFPREGNQNSYHYARRQYQLVDDPLLRYRFLNDFERAMHALDDDYHFVQHPHTYVSLKHEADKMIVFERGELVFVANFHPEKSFVDYKIGAYFAGKYRVVLMSDESRFGGHNRVDLNVTHVAREEHWCDRPYFLSVYSPCRTMMVLARISDDINTKMIRL